MTTISIAPSYIWTAYNKTAIGSKISDSGIFQHHFAIKFFETLLTQCIENHDHSKDRARGQHFIMLPNHLNRAEVTALIGDGYAMPEVSLAEVISCGVGLNTTDPNDYVHRLYRGRVQSFLKREHALPVDWCAVIVYTREAYLADPQMTEEEREKVLSGNASHFLVALLANAKDVPNAYGTYRLISNLCGGNNAFENMSLAEFKVEAQKSLEYQDKWCVVAD